MYKYLLKDLFSILLCIHLEMGLLGHVVTLFNFLGNQEFFEGLHFTTILGVQSAHLTSTQDKPTVKLGVTF